MTKNFVGFHTLEQLLKQADPERPIDALAITQPGPTGKYGISIEKQMIMVTQFSANGETLYCRIVTGHYQVLAGQIMSTRHDFPAIGLSAWLIVHEEIKQRGFTLREAVAALPRNLTFLDGSAECLHFNTQSDRYERKPVTQDEPA